jgi:hypothetical protein
MLIRHVSELVKRFVTVQQQASLEIKIYSNRHVLLIELLQNLSRI